MRSPSVSGRKIMIAVLGHLVVAADDREAHIALSLEAVLAARRAPGCLHFAVTADPVEPTWVDVAELWSSRADLDAFRNSSSAGNAPDPFAYVREFDVDEYEVNRT